MRTSVHIFAACLVALWAGRANGQAAPFFFPAGTGFDPEISVVNSGELLDAEVVVSKDRKYVTIGAQPSSSRLLALRSFSFQRAGNRPALGFVGGANAGLAGNGLDRRGMRRIRGLD